VVVPEPAAQVVGVEGELGQTVFYLLAGLILGYIRRRPCVDLGA